MVIVAIGAHPDDIEFGCYATLAKFSKSQEIHFLIFSAGELTGPKEKRIKEAKNSGGIIGADVEVLEYPDGYIPVNAESIKLLIEKINQHKPEIVFTLFPHDIHQDHRAVSRISISACRYVPKILFYEVPQTEKYFSPNYYVDVTEYFELKKRALKCFKTQANKSYLDISEIKGLARYRAYNVFRPNRLFEAFVLYRVMEL
jgi:LmbE family N-acetylglucosaminyl deacetylase